MSVVDPAQLGPLARLLGIELTEARDGRASCLLRVASDLLNPNGVLHGGAVYTMVDYAMGGATMSRLAPGETCATIEIKISYLAAVRQGTLTCEARVLKRGRQIVFLEAQVWDEARALVAAASGSFAVLRR